MTRKAWPHAQEIPNILDVTEAMVKAWFNQHPRVTHVHIIGGFPCVHLSSARAGRQNLSGEGSRLFWDLLQLIQWTRKIFGATAQVDFIVENVLSMDCDARDQISAWLDVKPLALDPADFLPYKRPRLAWVSRPVRATEGVELIDQGSFIRVVMKGKPVPDYAWIQPGWQRTEIDTQFPTFTKAIVRQRPPPQPAGIARCDAACLLRWESDSYKYPPYQYQRQYLLRDSAGNLRCLAADERELLLGFGFGHTMFALSAGIAKESPETFEDKRCSLCGDSFSMASFGWVISQFCEDWSTPMSPQQIVDRFGLAPGASLHPLLSVPMRRSLGYGPDYPQGSCQELTSHISRFVNHTGSDVSLAMGTPFTSKGGNHATLRADWWFWKVLFVTRWKFKNHINYLEMKMVLQSIRWRARSVAAVNSRWLHLADSMVCNYILSKGRTSSKLLQPLTREISAFLLALNALQLQGHVDSAENPTDAGSRQGHGA